MTGRHRGESKSYTAQALDRLKKNKIQTGVALLSWFVLLALFIAWLVV